MVRGAVVTLQDSHRAWLRHAQNQTVPTFQDFILSFCTAFNLSGTQAGALIAQWLHETIGEQTS